MLQLFQDFIEIWARGGSMTIQPVEAIEREKRSKEGWRICTVRCAPLIICPDWTGLGMQCVSLTYPGASRLR